MAVFRVLPVGAQLSFAFGRAWSLYYAVASHAWLWLSVFTGVFGLKGLSFSPCITVYEEEEEDLREVMDDPEFLHSVLRSLPGVDPQSEVVRNAVGNLEKDKKTSPKKEDKSKK